MSYAYFFLIKTPNYHTMKPASKISTTILFTVLILIIIPTVYWLFSEFFCLVLYLLEYLSSKLSMFFFVFLMLFIGYSIIMSIWSLFKLISAFIVLKLTRLCPYKNYAGLSILIISILCAFWAIYDFWSTIGWESTAIGLYGIVVSLFSISLFSLISNATYGYIFKEEL